MWDTILRLLTGNVCAILRGTRLRTCFLRVLLLKKSCKVQMALIKSDSKLSSLFVLKVLSQLGLYCTSVPLRQHSAGPCQNRVWSIKSGFRVHLGRLFQRKNWVQSPMVLRISEKKKSAFPQRLCSSFPSPSSAILPWDEPAQHKPAGINQQASQSGRHCSTPSCYSA